MNIKQTDILNNFSNNDDYSKENFLWRAIRRFETKSICRLLKENISKKRIDCMMEMGCGHGKYAELFCKTLDVKHSICSDFSFPMLRGAKLKKSDHIFLNANIEYLPIMSNSIDLSFCIGSMEFTDYKITLSEIFRVTKKEGEVILFFPRINFFYFFYRLLYKFKGIVLSNINIQEIKHYGRLYNYNIVASEKCGLFGRFILLTGKL